ncbi:sugar phosphate isomerase/epimerase [Mesorhizobium sp. M1169]|uniref:sugar phosphate isomerase/epimerase family protein n=1 Tax=Mesorhizobium sp. M1169 TaxID=2957066 RepID=UPI00333B4AB1
MERQRNLLKPRAHLTKETPGVVLALETDDYIIGIAHDDHVAGDRCVCCPWFRLDRLLAPRSRCGGERDWRAGAPGRPFRRRALPHTVPCTEAIDRTAGLDEARASSLKIVAERVADLALYAADRNVKLALEPLNPVYAGDRTCLTTVRDAVDICGAVDAPNLGVAVDVYHVWWDRDLDTQLQRAGIDRIFDYHLCDWLADTRDVLLDRGMMGDGVADLKAIRASVEGAGYTGPEFEIFSANNLKRQLLLNGRYNTQLHNIL